MRCLRSISLGRPAVMGLAIIFSASSIGAIAGSAGTTLTGTKTATVNKTQTETYAWTIQKTTPSPTPSPSPDPYTIGLGSSRQVPFTVVATRSGPTITTSTGLPSGQICVTNTGVLPTQGLYITDRLEQNIGGVWTQISGTITIPVSSELAASQTHCYPYQFAGVSLDSHLQYRNHATVLIDNYLGHEGTTFGIDVFTAVSFDTTIQSIDATATLTDIFQCPTGFACTQSWSTQSVSGSISIPISVTMDNSSVCCGNTISALNNVALVPVNSQIAQSASASSQIYTGVCPPCGSGTEFSIDNVSDSHMVIAPGATVIAGYNFKIPGAHPDTSLILLNGTVTIHVTCPNSTIQNVVIPLRLQSYFDPNGSSAWYPTDGQADPAGFQGSALVPSLLCGGVSGIASTGATFAGVFSSIPENACPNIRFHYQAAPIGAGANWSSTSVRVCGVCGPVCAPISTLEIERRLLEAELGVSLHDKTYCDSRK